MKGSGTHERGIRGRAVRYTTALSCLLSIIMGFLAVASAQKYGSDASKLGLKLGRLQLEGVRA